VKCEATPEERRRHLIETERALDDIEDRLRVKPHNRLVLTCGENELVELVRSLAEDNKEEAILAALSHDPPESVSDGQLKRVLRADRNEVVGLVDDDERRNPIIGRRITLQGPAPLGTCAIPLGSEKCVNDEKTDVPFRD
jgi:hypothetical protein